MKKKKKRKHRSKPHYDRVILRPAPAPVNPLQERLAEMNRLKPIIEAAKELSERERVKKFLKERNTK